MGLFGRSAKKDEIAAESSSDSESAVDSANDKQRDESASAKAPDGSVAATVGIRPDGPWDEAEDYPEGPRVDLGGLLIPQTDAVRLQVKVDPKTGSVSQFSILTDGSAVQIQAFAAPRTGGMWGDVRQQIISSINSSGGLVESTEGRYGTEVRAQVAGAEGKPQPARFCGIEGPRWFLRLVFLGKAARDEQAAATLDDVIRGIVVVRGDEAMPMGNALPLRVPPNEHGIGQGEPEAAAEPSATPDRPRITLPQRGPEITETR